MFDDDGLAVVGCAVAATLTILCPPAMTAIYIMLAAKAGKKIKEERAEEKATISRCETKNDGSNTIGFVYNGEVR